MKFEVVSEPTAAAVPDMTPVDVFKDKPDGKEPETIAKVSTVSDPSVAATVTLTDSPSVNVPKEPALVVHVGPFEYVIAVDDCTERPLLFSTTNLYVPSV